MNFNSSSYYVEAAMHAAQQHSAQTARRHYYLDQQFDVRLFIII
jgi:hypothetical protein